MIKLESKAAALPQLRALLVIESASPTPAVGLACEPVKEEVNGQWVESAANLRQHVSGYLDGKPFRLSGKVAQAYAVEVATCHKAVVAVDLKSTLTTAYEKGDRSREVCQLQLSHVVEVWETASKCLWRAKDGGNGASEPAAKEMDTNGRLIPATAGRV